MKIPYHIEVRRLYRSEPRSDDIIEHEVAFGVVGIDEPTRVIIQSDFYRSPVVVQQVNDGEVLLPQGLLDLLAIKCFRLMASEIIEGGGESGWWTIPDITSWIQHQFGPAESKLLRDRLSLQVKPDIEVRNICLVADDDAI